MANRIMKSVKSVSPGLTVLSTLFAYQGGKIVHPLTGKEFGPSEPLKISASDAKSFTIEHDTYAEVVGLHITPNSGQTGLLFTISGPPDVGQRKTRWGIDVSALALDASGADPELTLRPNDQAYTCSVTLMLKNSKARP